MKSEEKKIYSFWLCCIPGIGSRTIRKLLDIWESPEKVYEAPEENLGRILTPKQLDSLKSHKRQWNLKQEYDKLQEMGIGFLDLEDAKYPQRLRSIPDPPYMLFFRGSLPQHKRLSVAVVGARDCSEYGSYVAGELGRTLGENGVQVISGMARGIDGISQEAALRAGGESYGVLGCGVDICYPKQNRALYNTLLERGGILSAYIPGTLPRPQNFPPRNRIVSGLADVLVVIEARNKSGTLITVDMALEQGREVYVVPGRVTDRLSDGCNGLIRQGAGIVLSPTDFLEEMQKLFPERTEMKQREITNKGITQKESTLQEDIQKKNKVNCRIRSENVQIPKMGKDSAEDWIEKASLEFSEVYKALDFYPRSIEEIRRRLSKPCTVTHLNMMLVQLCLENHAIQLSPGYFCARH